MAEDKLIRKIVIKVDDKEAKDLSSVFEKLDKTLDKLNETIGKFATKINGSFEQVTNSASKLNSKILDASVKSVHLSRAISQLNQRYVEAIRSQNVSAHTLEVLNRQKSRLVAEANKVIKVLGQESDVARMLDNAVASLNVASKEYRHVLNGVSIGIVDLYRNMKRLGERYKEDIKNNKVSAQTLEELNLQKQRLIAQAKKVIQYKGHDARVTRILDKSIARLNIISKEYSKALRDANKEEKLSERIREAVARKTEQLVNANQKLKEKIVGLKERITNVNKSGKHFTGILDEWWQRFGKVALGFTIVYRGFNALEDAVRKTVDLLKEGISVAGQWTSMQAKMAMWAMIFPSNAQNFADAFAKARVNVEALVSQFPEALSGIDDLTQGFDELAQHGVFATRENAHSLMRFMDFINMIAQTTHESARQVRQEIQSIFEGQVRAGNTFLYLIKKLGISYEDLVKRVREGGDTTAAFLELIKRFTPYVDKMYKTVATGDVEVAARRWHMLIVYGFANATQIVSKLHGKINLFANDLYESANRIKDAFKGKLGEQWALAIEVLHQGFNGLLGIFEDILHVLPQVIVIFGAFFNELKKYKYAFLAAVGVKLLSKSILKLSTLLGTIKDLKEAGFALNGISVGITTVAAALWTLYEVHKHIVPSQTESAKEPPLLLYWVDKLIGKDSKDKLNDKAAKFKKNIADFGSKINKWAKDFAKQQLKDLQDLGKVLGKGLSALWDNIGKQTENYFNSDAFKKQIKALQKAIKDAQKASELHGKGVPNINFIKQLEGNLDQSINTLHSILVKYAQTGKDYTEVQKTYIAAIKLKIQNLKVIQDEIRKQLSKFGKQLAPADVVALKVKLEEITYQIEKLKQSIQDVNNIASQVKIKEIIDNLTTNISISLKRIKREFSGNTTEIAKHTLSITKQYLAIIDNLLNKWGDKLTPAQKNKLKKLKDNLLNAMQDASQKALSFWDALAKGSKDYVNEANNNLQDFQNATKNVFTQLENMLVDWMQKGKMNFKDFLRSIVSMYEHILVRKFLVKPFAQASENIFNTIANYLFGQKNSSISSFIDQYKNKWNSMNKSFWVNLGVSTLSSLATSYFNANTTSSNIQVGGSPNAYRGPSTSDYMQWYKEAKLSAYGNIFDKPTLTVAGEGPYKEAVIPMLDGQHVLAKVVDNDNNYGKININVYANDAQSAARAVKQAMVQLNKGSTSLKVRKF